MALVSQSSLIRKGTVYIVDIFRVQEFVWTWEIFCLDGGLLENFQHWSGLPYLANFKFGPKICLFLWDLADSGLKLTPKGNVEQRRITSFFNFFQLDKSRNVGIFFPLPSPFSFNERNSLAIVDELQLTIIRLGDDDIQVTSDGFDMCVVLMIPKTAEWRLTDRSCNIKWSAW